MLAREREPSLRAARAAIDAARARRLQAGLRPNPTLSFDRRGEPGGTDSLTTVSVQWPLDLFRRTARVEVREREIEATEQSAADRVRTIVADVRMRYGAAAAAARDVAVVEQVAASIRRQHDIMRQRAGEGASPPLERDLVEVELRRAESEQLLAAGRAEAALFDLKRLLGMSAETPLTLRDTLEALVSTGELADSTDGSSAAMPSDSQSPERRPDVLEADARVRLAEARLEEARSGGRFDVNLFGGYMRMDAGFPQRAFSGNGTLERVRGRFNYLSAGAMVTVPLRNRNQGEIAAAQAERTAAEALLDAARLDVEAEIGAAAAQAANARSALALIGNSVSLARKNLDVMQQTYGLGRATLHDVLAEQRRYLDVEQAYTETMRRSFEARAALQRAQGDLE